MAALATSESQIMSAIGKKAAAGATHAYKDILSDFNTSPGKASQYEVVN